MNAKLRDVAVQVAGEAADLARTVRDESVTEGSVGTKSTETDVVTAGDRAVERLVRERLAELRPGEAVLGEEGAGEEGAGEGGAGEDGAGGAGTGEEPAGAADLSGLRWVVDPIDGTVNYLYGYPWYAVSLAAQVDGSSVAGAVVEPVSGRVWSAARGGGAHLGSTPLRTSTSDRLDLALVGTGFAYAVERRAAQAAAVSRLLREVRDLRRSGVASLDLCSVAAGWLDGYYEVGLKRWDWAAGALVAEEAGAAVRLPTADGLGTDGVGTDGVGIEGVGTDGLGTEALVCAAPALAGELTAALLRAGAAEV